MGDYGKVTSLSIDSQSKSIKLVLSLKGEEQPIEITVANYALDDNAKTVTLTDMHTSREWLTAILNNFVSRKPFKVDERVFTALTLIA